MSIVIEIEHTSKLNKTGKLTLKNNNITILNKVPISVPPNFYKLVKDGLLTIKETVYGPILYIDNEPLLYSAPVNNENEHLASDLMLFMVRGKTFKTLLNTVGEGGIGTIRAKSVKFLWFTEPTKKPEHTLMYSLANLTTKEVYAHMPRPKRKISKINAIKYHNAISKRLHSKMDDDNGQSPLDIAMLMCFPSIAPILKPQSMLAWVLFMQANNKNIQLEDIQKIKGFENVEKIHHENNKISLFLDNKNIDIINDNNNYIFNDEYGNEAVLTKSKNIWSGTIMGEKTLSFELVKENEGFIGNWHTSENENSNSSLYINENFKTVSEANSPVDLSYFATPLNWEPKDNIVYESYKDNISTESNPYNNSIFTSDNNDFSFTRNEDSSSYFSDDSSSSYEL